MRGRHLHDLVDALGSDPADLRGRVAFPVIDDVISAGGRGQRCLRRSTHGRDHNGAGPLGELDRRMAHGAGPTRNENYLAVQGSRAQPPRAVLGDGQGPVGGDRGNAQACAEVEPSIVRQRKDPLGRQDGELLGCPAVGALVGARATQTLSPTWRCSTPGPTASTVPAPSWFGTTSAKGKGSPGLAPRRDFQSVGFAAEEHHPHAHLPAARVADLAVDEFENRRITRGTVHDCFHTQA